MHEVGSLDNRAYIPRLIDSTIEKHLKAFGAIEISGTMWCGKTWTSLYHSSSSIRLDVDSDRVLATLAPEAVLEGAKPRVIDEWQEVPQIWDVVRHAVDDAAGEKGLFILTGSSRPARQKTHHSGSGRISRLRMWPMSLAEVGASNKTVSLKGLFEGEFYSGKVSNSLEDLTKYVICGGWPDAVQLEQEEAHLIPYQYLDTLISARDEASPENENDLRNFLTSLARNIGSSVKINTLVSDMNYEVEGRITETGRKRIRELLDYFAGRYLVDSQTGWNAPIRSPQRLRTKPRYNFADPSLPAALLGVNESALLSNTQLFGQLFEQLCLRDLNVYASALPLYASPLRYYRDDDGLEVDAIIELRDGRWGAIEIKLGWNKVDLAESNLLRLKSKIAANPAARNPEPSFMMVLVGVSEHCYQTKNGVYVVPITELTA